MGFFGVVVDDFVVIEFNFWLYDYGDYMFLGGF